MKDNYAIFIIRNRCYHSKVVADLAGKTNRYGMRRDVEVVHKSLMAEKIIRYSENRSCTQKEVAEVIAKVITVALEFGKPVYGDVGVTFLKEKDLNYKNSKLSIILTKIMLHGIEFEEKDFILRETEKILEGETDLSDEAKAAIIAIKIYDGANKCADQRRFNDVSTSVLGKVMRATYANGCVTEVPSMKALADFKTEKKLVQRTNQDKEILETVYTYYVENYKEIPSEFIIAAENFTPEHIAAYYVASMRETDLLKVYAAQI